MIVSPKIARRIVRLDDYDGWWSEELTVDEARQLAHEILCAAEKVDGNGCVIACFTRQGAVFPADRESICKKITDLVDNTGEIDGVVVFKQKEIA